MCMILGIVLCGCEGKDGSTDSSAGGDNSDESSSKNINETGIIPSLEKLVAVNMGGASYGDYYDCADVFVTVYRDHTVKITYEDEELGMTTLSSSEYKNIEEAVDYDVLENLDIESDNGVCDGSSYYLYVFYENDIEKAIGAYEPTNSEFRERYKTVINNLPREWIQTVRDELAERLMNESIGNGPFFVVIENPGKGYYISPDAPDGDSQDFYWYSDKTSKENNIIDEEDWLLEHGFPDCRVQTQEGYYIVDSGYYIYRGGEDIYYPTELEFFDEEMNFLGTIDLSKFVNGDIVEADNWPFCPRGINWACLKDDGKTLYVSISHNTYASFNSENAYILAINIETMELIWKSECLVSNANNFAIVGDTIFCGYGFTDEDDYLYALNRFNGEITDRVKLKTGPSYIYEKDGILYVRTYNTDYEFTLTKK